MTKIIFLFFLIILINSIYVQPSLANANGQTKQKTQTQEEKKKSKMLGFSTLAPEMEILINQSKDLKEKYQTCIDTNDTNTPTKSVASCMSEGLIPRELQDIALRLKEIKKKRKEKLGLSTEEDSNSSSDPKKAQNLKYEGRDIINITTKKDKALIALEDYMMKKLQKAMGKALGGDKKINYYHGIYFELYESQLGKNIISAYSSYCLEADSVSTSKGYFKIKTAEIKDNRTRNLKLLQDKTAGKAYFKACILKIPSLCHALKDNGKIAPEEEDYETKKRACQVVSQVEAGRQMLIANRKIKEAFDKRLGGKTNINLDIEKVTTLTSNELNDKENKYAAEIKKQQELAKKCQSDPSLKDCDQFLEDHNLEQLAISEYAIKSKLAEENLKKIDTNNDELIKYLKEQDYTEQQIKAMMSDETKLNELKEEIQNRYKTKRVNLIAAMNARLTSKTINEKSTESADQQKQTIIENSTQELEKKVLEFKENIYFTNIMSSYLEVEQSDGKKVANTQSIKAELENSAFDKQKVQTGTDPASSNVMFDNFDKVKERGIGKTQQTSDSTSTRLNVDTINAALLKYKNQPDFSKKKQFP